MTQRETVVSFLWRKIKKSPPPLLLLLFIVYHCIKTGTEMVFCCIYSFHTVQWSACTMLQVVRL